MIRAKMLKRRKSAAATIAALAPLAAIVVVASALAGTGDRPDLVVAAGSVTTSHGKLQGSLVVRNQGAAGSGRFAVSLLVAKPGKDRLAKRFEERPLPASGSRTVKVSVRIPARLPAGTLAVKACAKETGKARGHSAANDCRKIGTVTAKAGTGGSGGPGGSPGSGGPGGPAAPPSSFPTNPIAFTAGVPFTLNSPESNYWIDVPTTYDATHHTPTTLFVWLHGCGGESAGDIYNVSPGGSQDWISIAVGGREGDCWDPNADQGKVLAAIADVKTHFNIEPHRVILGGYSSGGDLAYRLAFYNSASFAGVLAENTSPFRDTGSTQAASLAAATVKFHVVHLAHLQDTTYPIAGVRGETQAMVAAGFPLTRIEVDGGHYDEPGAIENGHPVPGTDADVATYLLPHIDDGWRSP
jgi:hypothetical protein